MRSLNQRNPDPKVLKFLRKIGADCIKKYQIINDVFVPPLEYDNIKKALSEDKVVFITGTKEYGKTYIAIRLLWEYFINGYEPTWLKGQKGSETRSSLLNVERYLKPHHIIYFEDRFGKTEERW